MTGLTVDRLIKTFWTKHGSPRDCGSGPARRFRFGYFTPDDVYETVLAQLVSPRSAWLDVGGGRDVFPSNPALARQLATRCGVLVGIDPDNNIHDNSYVHERVQTTIEEFKSERSFDVVSMRMVAEHMTNPEAVIGALGRLVQPRGKVVIYTVNWYSPITLCSRAVPFHFHHACKQILWQTEERDTFPTAYKMNTRKQLRRLFNQEHFRELYFAYLDDCRTFARFRFLNLMELSFWRILRTLGLPYPETCLLGVYERLEHPSRNH
jgi:SAM-dependent methyltransferase